MIALSAMEPEQQLRRYPEPHSRWRLALSSGEVLDLQPVPTLHAPVSEWSPSKR